MPELLWCVSLEWGWWFWMPALGVALLLLIWFGFLILRGGGSLSVGYEKVKVITTGSGPLGVVVTTAIVGLVIYGVYQGYKSLKDAYFVSLNTGGRELEQVRNDFQGETHVEISVKDPAKKFVIAGSYHGACAPDLFESICRQYAPRIVCETSLSKRTLIVDLKKP